MIVRAVTAQDFEQWLRLWGGYNAFYGRSGSTALDPAVTRLTWARLLDGAEPVHGLVAEAEGTLIGLAHCIFHRSTTVAGDVCYMQDLFTAPAVRGQGVGRALIAAVYELAGEKGCTRVYWHTHESNRQARRLYDQMAEKSGFIVYRRTV